MNEVDDLDQLKRDFGPALLLALRQVASQIKPEDMPRFDSGEMLMGYVTPESVEQPLPDEPRRARVRGALLISAVSVAAAVVAVAVLNRPSGDASPVEAPTTTSTSVPPLADASSYLLDVGTGQRSPLPAELVDGFSLSDTRVSAYVPSPDGTRVVMISQCSSAPCAGGVRMAVGNIDGSDVRTISGPLGWAAPQMPSWSPDGTKIVYEMAKGGGDTKAVFVDDLTTGARTQLTEERAFSGAWNLWPAFTPDGQTVLFTLPRDTAGNSDVWSVPVAGGEPALVIERAMAAAPLPDGTIAFARSPFGSGIRVATIDESSSAPILGPATAVFGLAASPDGTRLLYGRPAGPSLTGKPSPGGITVVDASTGAVERELDGPVLAGWFDNDTLIVTEFA